MENKSQLLKITLAFALSWLFYACTPQTKQNFAPNETESQDSNGIVGGKKETLNEVSRHLVMIYGENERNESYVCTGTLIDTNVVLTAAHCIGKLQTMMVYFGLNPFDDATTIESLAIKTLKHKDYNKKALIRNDIAMIKISPRKPKDYLVATLPWKNEKVKSYLDAQKELNFKAIGYGVTTGKDPGSKDPSKTSDRGVAILRSVPLKLLDFTAALDAFSVDQSKGKGVCSGDSGGPAIVEVPNGKETLVTVLGLASHVIEDAPNANSDGDDCNYQAKYTNIWYYQEWIDENLKTF